MQLRLILSIKNKVLQDGIAKAFSAADVQVLCFGSMRNQWQKVVQSCGDIIAISDSLLQHPVESGLEVLSSLPETPTTIVFLDSDSPEDHAQLLTAGADVVLYSGLSINRLTDTIETTLESRRQLFNQERREVMGQTKPKLSDFNSSSETMQLFLNDVSRVAPTNSTLLLLGETGVGKEYLARAIHEESARSNGPFIALNAAALPEQLLESELFGHSRGAFTGATRSRRGAFEMAHGGTIFLDEIGEMPLHLQAKLLRVLQDFEIKPLGAEKSIWVDVRVIAATNKDLEEEVALKNFRKDLYFRLSVMALIIPPLRERREDIPMLARRFFTLYKYSIGKEVSYIADSAIQALCRYDWPGNVRELMNVIERAMLICRSNEITLQDLPDFFHQRIPLGNNLVPEAHETALSWEGKTLPEVQKDIADQVERLYFQMVLTKTHGRIGEAAGLAGIHSRGLYNKMKRLGLRKEDFKKK